MYVFTVLHIYNHRYVALCSVLSFSDYRNLPLGILQEAIQGTVCMGEAKET